MEVLGAIKAGEYTNVLEVRSCAIPSNSQLQPQDVLIQVMYSDVNPVDLQKLRNYKPSPATSGSSPYFVPGYGGSGTVLHVGSQLSQSLVGKKVCFIVDPSKQGQGSYATHVIVDSRCMAALPSNVDVREAASIPVAGLTAYESLVKLGLAVPTGNAAATTPKEETNPSATRRASQGFSPPASPTKAGRRASRGSFASPPTSPTKKVQGLLVATAPDTTTTSATNVKKTLLIVGGSGGVGSWATILARAWYPNLEIIATTSKQEHQEEWCVSLGATKAIRHDEIQTKLVGGRDGSVDYILCLTEPTMPLFDALSNVIRPYGQICLVVAGKGIESLNMSFCFFKGVTVHCQTVFSSIRTNYQHIVPSAELEMILALITKQTIKAPISPDLDSSGLSEKFQRALQPNGVLYALQNKPHGRRGKFVLEVQGGDELIFIDIKTVSLILIPRRDCIKAKVLTISSQSEGDSSSPAKGSSPSSSSSSSSWKEQASLIEKPQLIKKLTTHPTLGISKVADRQWTDYQDGLEMQEAENVKNLWGVQLKKREKNKQGQELYFVDPKTGAIGEVLRKGVLDANLMTVETIENKERIKECVSEDERDEVLGKIRRALKINPE